MFERTYLFYSGVTVWVLEGFSGVISIPAHFQDCQCSSREDIKSYVQIPDDQACSCAVKPVNVCKILPMVYAPSWCNYCCTL